MKHFMLFERMRQISLILTVFFVVFTMMSVADLASAKHGINWRDITQAGWALWMFIIVGSIIILLQLIPAVVLFFSFLGSGTKMVSNGLGQKEETECCRKEEVRA